MQQISSGHKYCNKSIVSINNGNPYTALTLPKHEQSVKQQQQLNYNTILLSASLSIYQPLNFCLKRRADLFKIWIKNKLITVTLQTSESLYSFQDMNYLMFLKANSNRKSEKVQIAIQKLQCRTHMSYVQFKIRITQNGMDITQLRKNRQIIVEFGNQNINKVIACQISNFGLESSMSQSYSQDLSSPFENKISFKDLNYQLPITLVSKTQDIYEAFNIDQSSYIKQSIQSVIDALPKYFFPQSDKENRLYICHDMKGGYIEDLNLDNNLDVKTIGEFVRYRSLHLQQTEIFNYFSHHNITIPPKHWRILCRKYKTKCLGTFIIEKPKVIDENVLSSNELALFLVAIAKKCQFDGYLINIQTDIKAITAFKKWLDFLTRTIHNHIPNSSIIWYDSISSSDGIIRYQNSLNQANYQFYHITDGLFTNYWWNEQLLKTSLNFKKENLKKVYIGNDCFGRGTYEGGQYNIHKAVNKILEYKNQLSIALFAPGFTYEDKGAQINRPLFLNQELQMFKGVKSQYIPVTKWKYVKGQGKDWKEQGDWLTTSFQLCQRQATFKFNSIDKNTVVKVSVNCQVKGTQPLFDSPYKIIVQLLDSDENVVYQTSSHNFNDYKKASQDIEFYNQEVIVSADQIGQKQYAVKIIEMGKSKQRWAGHYGPKFRGQYISVLVYEKEKHWTSKISPKLLTIGQNYHSYLNISFGDHFHYLGEKKQSPYSYLMDFDQPHTHIINLPFDTSFNYKQAFIGGSSLSIAKSSIKLCRAIVPKNLNLQDQYFLQLTFKNTSSIDVVFKYVTNLAEQRIFSAVPSQTENINGWKRCTYKLNTTQKEAKSEIRSLIQINSLQFPYCLGEIKFVKKQKKQPYKLSVKVEISQSRLSTSNHYLNIQLSCPNPKLKRSLVILQDYVGFAYFQNEKAYVRNISISKCQSINIQIKEEDSFLQSLLLKQITINGQSLVDLIFKGSIQFQ